jgi:hypothetical protein
VSLTLLTVIITAREGEALWAPVLRWYRKAAS